MYNLNSLISGDSKIHPDLIQERKQATFKKEELTYLLYGGREKYKRKEYLSKLKNSH